MRKEEVKNYTITTDGPSGLEFELHLMPQFFNSAVCLEQSSHTHTYYQIIWFRRGYGIHQVDFVDYPVDDNTLFFIAPGQVHSFHGSRDCEGVIIRFNASFMADEQSSESIFLKYDIFNAYDSLPYYKITDAESDHLYILVQAMRIELSLKSAFAHKDYMQYLVRLFLIRVQRAGTRRAVQKLSVSCVAPAVSCASASCWRSTSARSTPSRSMPRCSMSRPVRSPTMSPRAPTSRPCRSSTTASSSKPNASCSIPRSVSRRSVISWASMIPPISSSFSSV